MNRKSMINSSEGNKFVPLWSSRTHTNALKAGYITVLHQEMRHIMATAATSVVIERLQELHGRRRDGAGSLRASVIMNWDRREYAAGGFLQRGGAGRRVVVPRRRVSTGAGFPPRRHRSATQGLSVGHPGELLHQGHEVSCRRVDYLGGVGVDDHRLLLLFLAAGALAGDGGAGGGRSGAGLVDHVGHPVYPQRRRSGDAVAIALSRRAHGDDQQTRLKETSDEIWWKEMTRQKLVATRSCSLITDVALTLYLALWRERKGELVAWGEGSQPF